MKGEEKWDLKDIENIKQKRGSNNILVRPKWTNGAEDFIWYSIVNFNHAKNILRKFYKKHPDKFKSIWLNVDDENIEDEN